MLTFIFIIWTTARTNIKCIEDYVKILDWTKHKHERAHSFCDVVEIDYAVASTKRAQLSSLIPTLDVLFIIELEPMVGSEKVSHFT